MADQGEQEAFLGKSESCISLPAPDFLRSFSHLSDEDSDFEDLPDFTGDGTDGGVDVFCFLPGDNSTTVPKDIQFNAIHNSPQPFSTIRYNCWIPGVPVIVKLTQAERNNPHIKIFNPNLYTIHISHGEYQWSIRRRFKHFVSLHQHLRLFRMRYKFVPTKTHKDRRQSMKKQGSKVPRFPQKPEIMIRGERDLQKRKTHLEEYLQNLLNINVYRNHMETLKFLEVCHLSFVKRLGKKWKEGSVEKCSGGRRISIGCCGCLSKFHLFGRWKNRWLLVKDSFIAYIRPRDGVICDVMLMDSQFSVQNGFGKTGAKHGIQITNLTRVLLAKCWTSRKADEWQGAIEKAAESIMGKDYTQYNRFESFAPVRENSCARWFVDGATYFACIAEALENAQEEIFITDWWLSPEIYMKRPITEGNKWRLDQILERKAKQGVKIFILLYKEMELALNLSSRYSKQTLVNKCPENIKIIRHPDHGAGGVLLWGHHEKLVAIDQKVAFLGGLDLCYGRWDDGKHRLADLGCIVYDSPNRSEQDGPRIQIDEAESNEVGADTRTLTGIQINISPPSPMPSRRSSLDSNIVENLSSNDEEFHDALNDLSPSDNEESQKKENSIKNEEGMKEDESKKLHNHVGSENECVCKRLGATSEPHAYDNDSLEEEGEEEYDKLMHIKGRGGKDRWKTAGSGEGQGQVVKATVHNENMANKPVAMFDVVRQVLEKNKKEKDTTTVDSSQVHKGSENGIQDIDEVLSLSVKDARNSIMKNSQKRNKGNNVKFKRDSEESAKLSLKQENEDSGNEGKRESESLKDKEKKQGFKFSFRGKKSDKGQDVECVGFKHLDNDVQSGGKGVSKNSGKSHKYRRSISEQPQSSFDQTTEDSHNKETKRSGWSRGIFQRSLSNPEENNNQHAGNADNTGRDSSGIAQRRWKMVLNVQKFHSAVKQQQEEMPLPKSEKKAVGPTISSRIVSLYVHMKDSVFSVCPSVGLMVPPKLQRTSSELAIDELGLKGSSKLWIGKDYCNFIHKDFVDLDDPFADFIDRSQTPRMPWHDIGAVVYGKAARDVSRHFIGRWNAAKVEKLKRNKDYPLLLPKAYSHGSLIPTAVKECCNEVKTQILRSASPWSASIQVTENSIQSAYIHCIESAKHYIYIENQFFISHIGDHSSVKNKIGDTLYHRIIRAHRNDENFKVFVVMPLLPAFEGEIGGDGAFAIQAVTHYNYSSISKGPNSIWQKLRKEDFADYLDEFMIHNFVVIVLVMDPLKYIVFLGLRKHEELQGKLVTELVYVHSKLMIVDDDTVIIGSANINDRSMMGDRDSELAIMVQDVKKDPVYFNGVQHKAGKFASSLRKSLFREHLGLEKTDPVVDDIMSDNFYKKVLLYQASINTTVFQKVFNCVPNDLVKTFAELKAFTRRKNMAETDPARARAELKKVKGHVVLLPLYFLEDESSIIPTHGKESFLPNSVWT
ncbi:hypothetical protein FSP39_002327 [Pinctada imbricata]|uniref:Phospholipase n=1 Tax=Pinctada imbricata TaxID=66713 RepID=A0AA88Y1N0_PINIB|nr:hypothetical protein FSP39_002327 [Pinctada imbricata]